MFPRFCGTRCREKKGRDPSKNYSPPIPPTKIPFLLTPDHFYVRFLAFSVFHFLPSFFSFLDPIAPQGVTFRGPLVFCRPLPRPPRKTMENPWEIHGFPWTHGVPWGPMGSPWASMENPRMSEIMDFNENHYSVRQK